MKALVLLVGEELAKSLGAAIAVENRPGSGGVIGTSPSPQLLEKQMREDYARWARLVAEAKLKVD